MNNTRKVLGVFLGSLSTMFFIRRPFKQRTFQGSLDDKTYFSFKNFILFAKLDIHLF